VELLYLSHCVPYPPNKGEKIRAFYEIEALASRHRVHLACFARTPSEMEDAKHLLGNPCASVYAAPLFPFPLHAARALARFCAGGCLNSSFYSSRALRRDVAALHAQVKLDAAVAYTAVMAPFVPNDLPFVLDYIDVDSEKWLAYAKRRQPSLFYRLEAGRVRRLEIAQGRRARLGLFTTQAEESVFRSFAADIPTAYLENGVESRYFDPAAVKPDPALAGRDYLLFVGSMDYYPNTEAAERFARDIFPALRAAAPGLELLIVGRKPTQSVFALGRVDGVEVVGTVEDVRPYYLGCRAVVAPLSIARGIQNKVLEALAMERPVLASRAICRTFGQTLPKGVYECESVEDYARPVETGRIRKHAMARFSWTSNLGVLIRAVDQLRRPSR
ncbi:MAG: TIGR03087 family PEP-CTERM/XrtA system glycosyltransferase, partial [Candidatus Solibacter sp.]|nr:TIGR03087 family PEP-CTERM/XrtA system glycosyltransferase [Candidatus Solibacter sp.]